MANDNKITIELEAKAEKYISGLSNATKETEKLTTLLTKSKTLKEDLAKAEEKLAVASIGGNQQSIASALSKIDIIKQQQAQVNQSLKSETDGYEKLQGTIEKAVNKGKEKQKELDESISSTAQKTLAGLNTAFLSLFDSLAKGELPVHQLESAISGVGSLFGVVGVGAAQFLNTIIGVTEGVAEFTNKANEAAKLQRLFADISGLKAETLESFELAAKSIGGTTVQVIQLTDKFAGLINKAKEGGKEGATAAEVLAKLKIPIEDINKPLNDLFDQALEGFNTLEAGAEKAEVSFKAFGLRGSKTFSELSQNAKEFKQIIRDSGVLFDEKQQEDLRRYSLASLELKEILEGITRQAGAEFAPILTDLSKDLKFAIDAIKADPATIAGLKVLFETFEQIAFFVGESLIEDFQDFTKVLGQLGIALEAIQSPLETIDKLFEAFANGQIKAFDGTELLKIAAGNLSPVLDRLQIIAAAKAKADKEAADATKKHTEELAKQKEALNNTTTSADNAKIAIEQLGEANKLAAEQVKSASDERISAIQTEVDAETKGRSEGAKEILDQTQNRNSQLINLAQKLVDETASKASLSVELEKKSEDAKIALIKLTTETKRSEEKAKAEIEKATLAEIKEANEIAKNTRISQATQAIEKINELEKQADSRHKQSAEERAGITRNLILAEIAEQQKLVDNTEVNEKARSEARRQLSKLRTDLDKADAKSAKETEEGAVKDAIEANNARISSDQVRFEKLKQIREQAAMEERQQGVDAFTIAQNDTTARIDLINQEIASRKKTIEILQSINAEQSKINQQEKEIQKLEEQKTKTLEDQLKKRQQIQDALNTKELADDKIAFDRKVEQLKQLGATEQQIALQTSQFNLQETNKQIQSILKKIETTKQEPGTDVELINLNTQLDQLYGKQAEQIRNINNLIKQQPSDVKATQKALQEGLANGNDAFAKSVEASATSVEKLGDRAKSAVGAIGRGGVRIGESFDIASQSAEQLQIRIDELNNSANFIEAFFAGPGKQDFVNDIRETVAKLNTQLVERTQRAALQAQAEQAAEELRTQQEKGQKLVDLNQERIRSLIDLEKDYRDDIKKLEGDRAKEDSDFLEKSADRFKKYNEDRTKLEEDFAKREREIKDKAAQDEINRIKQLEQAKTQSENESEKERNRTGLDNLAKEVDLVKQINKEKDPSKKAEKEKELTELTEKNRKKEELEKQKQVEIQKALESSSSKEEFEAKKAAIQEKFDLLKQEQLERQNVIDSGDKQRLAKFDEFIAKEKERIATQLANTLEGIRQEQALKVKQAEDEKAQRQKDYEQRQKDRKDQFNEDQKQADNDHKDRLGKIDEQQREIRAKYKETYTEINQRAVDSAKQIGVTGQAIADAFKLGNAEAQKYLDTLGKITDAQGNVNTPGGGNGGNGAGNNANNGSGSTANSNNNSGNNSSSSNSNNNGNSSNNNNNNTNNSSNSDGKTKNQKKKERAEEIEKLPKTAKDSSEYRTNANKIFDEYGKFIEDRKSNFTVLGKYFDVFRTLTVDYFAQSKVVVPPNEANSFGLPFGILDPASQAFQFANKKEDKARFNKVIDTVIKFVEDTKKAQDKLGDKFGDKSGGVKITDAKPVDVSGSGGGGGRVALDDPNGDTGAPGQLPKKPERSDQEKALFAGRAQDAQNKGGGDDEAFKEGDAILDPDSAIDPAARPSNRATTRPKTNTTITTTGGDKPPTNQTAPNINNSPTFAPTFAPTFQVIIQPKEQPTTANINQSLNALNTAFQDVSNQSAQAVMRTLTQQILDKIGQNFRG